MRVSKHDDHITYSEGKYSLDVYTDGNAFLKHKCTGSTREDSCFDFILPNELENNACRYCDEDELNIPENIQALFYLYRWGRPDKATR